MAAISIRHAIRNGLCVLLAGLPLATTAAAASSPADWEGMTRVERPGLDEVYLRDGATLAKYRRVQLEPVEVSFDRNWKAQGASPSRVLPGRVDTQRIRTDLAKLAREATRRELERGGAYSLTEESGDDVLRVRARIVDLYINAPDAMTPGVQAYVVNAGEMTLVADLYDSESGVHIGHVVDRQRGLDTGPWDLRLANRVTNAAEADRILSGWARRLRSALDRAR